MKLDKIYSIHLKNSSRKKPYTNAFQSVEVIEAVDARQNPLICKDYGLTVRPMTISFKLLFDTSPGAVGCYLSHYSIWTKIVKEKISYALVLEDDVHRQHVDKFLQSDFQIDKNYDLIQLTKRFYYHKNGHIEFNGTESYIVSYQGANKLLNAAHEPELLKDITNYHEFINVQKYLDLHELQKPAPSYEKMSIIAPVDKHIVLCCHPNANRKIRLDFLHHPCIGLDTNLCHKSEISPNTPAWLIKLEQLDQFSIWKELSPISK